MPTQVNWREVVTFVVAMVVILGFFGLVILLTVENKLTPDQQNFMMGVLVGNFTAAVSFYVGSSQGSTAKTGTIEKIAESK